MTINTTVNENETREGHARVCNAICVRKRLHFSEQTSTLKFHCIALPDFKHHISFTTNCLLLLNTCNCVMLQNHAVMLRVENNLDGVIAQENVGEVQIQPKLNKFWKFGYACNRLVVHDYTRESDILEMKDAHKTDVYKLVTIIPVSDDAKNALNSFGRYLHKRRKAGICTFDDYTMYILPPPSASDDKPHKTLTGMCTLLENYPVAKKVPKCEVLMKTVSRQRDAPPKQHYNAGNAEEKMVMKIREATAAHNQAAGGVVRGNGGVAMWWGDENVENERANKAAAAFVATMGGRKQKREREGDEK